MFALFTERARQVVVLAQEAARALKRNYIGTEHLLLGLVRDGDGVAGRILLDLDADSEKIRNQVMRLLSAPGRVAARAWRVQLSGRVKSWEHRCGPAHELGTGPPDRSLTA